MTTVVHVSLHLDRADRDPEVLLDAWPTLPGCVLAAHRAGVDIAVIQPSGRDHTLVRDGVSFHFVRETPGIRRGTAGTRPVALRPERIAQKLHSLQPRLIHVHGLSLTGQGAWLKKRTGATLLMQDHADKPPRPWRRPSARRALRSLDGVLFTAREQADPYFETNLFRPDLPVYEVIESSASFGPGDMTDAQNATGLHGDPCILWLGRLDANKDPLTVLSGFAAAAPAMTDPHLWMCYRDGVLEHEVRRQAERHPQLRGRVHLLGSRDHAEVETLLQAADMLVQGSHREGSGYAVLEAMACGTIPLITRIPPFVRIAGDAAVYWTVGDPDDLARSVASVATADRPGLRARALDRFDRALSWDALGRDLALVYERVLDARSVRGSRAHTGPPDAPGDRLPQPSSAQL